jgi:hypothetical protein
MDVPETLDLALKQIALNQEESARLRTQLEASKAMLHEIQADVGKVDTQVLPAVQAMDSGVQKSAASIHDVSTRVQTAFKDTEQKIAETQRQAVQDFEFVKEALTKMSSDQAKLFSKLHEAQENGKKTAEKVQTSCRQILEQFHQPLQDLSSFLTGEFKTQLEQDQKALEEQGKELVKNVKEGLIKQAEAQLAQTEKELKEVREMLQKRKTEIKSASDKSSSEALNRLTGGITKQLEQTEKKAKDTIEKFKKLTKDIRKCADDTSKVMKNFGLASTASATGLETLCGLVNELRAALKKAGIDV